MKKTKTNGTTLIGAAIILIVTIFVSPLVMATKPASAQEKAKVVQDVKQLLLDAECCCDYCVEPR